VRVVKRLVGDEPVNVSGFYPCIVEAGFNAF
jgi:hypothetical protein